MTITGWKCVTLEVEGAR